MFYGAYIFIGINDDKTIHVLDYFPFEIRDLREPSLNPLTFIANGISTNVLTKEGRKLFGLEEGEINL